MQGNVSTSNKNAYHGPYSEIIGQNTSEGNTEYFFTAFQSPLANAGCPLRPE